MIITANDHQLCACATAGWLQGLSGNTTDTRGQRNYLSALAFNPAGTLASFHLGNVASTAMTYDDRNRPTGITNAVGAGSPFSSGLYQYDGAGNISDIGAQHFAYDRLNRLTDAHVTRTLANTSVLGAQDIHYSYDLFGNMASKTSAASALAPAGSTFLNDLNFGAPTLRDYTLAPPVTPAGATPLPEYSITNRIKEAGYAYDANGNLIEDPKNCYSYDELNRMTKAIPKDASGACGANPIANYFYDADNLRVLKQLWPTTGTVPLKLITTVRGGLDTVSDMTTHVSDGQESSHPFEQKNYVYGPGGLIASENRTYNAFGVSRWQIYGASTGCTPNAMPATALNLQSTGYDLALDFGQCSSASAKLLTIEWHELNADGMPKSCTNEQFDATTNFNARYNCGLLHIDPAVGTDLLHKFKYDTGYSVKATVHADLGLYGVRDFVVNSFTVKLAKNSSAANLAFTDTTPSSGAVSSIGSPGPGGRVVNYYQKDHLGTIRIVSDESGTVLSTHDYEPFGLELPGVDFSDNTHRFTGHERDTETGLDYMKARYYGASMGRFGTVDPAQATNNYLPKTWNYFIYGNNNP